MKVSASGNTEFESAPVGTAAARCIKLIDIGTQEGEWQGKKNYRRQAILTWELPNTPMSEGDNAGKPFIVNKFYTASLGEKATLRHDLVSWRGREFTVGELQEFDLKNILGKPCLVSVVHNENGKAKVQGVIALPKGMDIPAQINQTVYFSLDEFDQTVFDSLSDGIKKMIIASPEYQRIVSGEPKKPEGGGGDFDDFESDVPF